MRAEQAVEEAGDVFDESLRMDNEQLGNVLTFYLTQPWVIADLAKGRSQSKRISAKLSSPSISHILTLSTDGKAGKKGEKVANGSQDDSHQHNDDNGCTRVAILATRSHATISATKNQRVPHDAYSKSHERTHDSHEDDAYDEQAGVTIADVGQLMTNHTSQLVIAETVADASSDGDGIAVVIDAAGKRVELRIIDDINLRHRHTTRHGEILHNVVDARILSTLQRTGSRGLAYHCGIGEVRDGKPDANNHQYPRQDSFHLIVDIVPIHRYDITVSWVTHAKIGQSNQERIDNSQENAWEKSQQDFDPRFAEMTRTEAGKEKRKIRLAKEQLKQLKETVKQAERAVADGEAAVAAHEALMAAPETYAVPEKAAAAAREYQRLKDALSEAYSAWERAEEALAEAADN